MLSPVEAGEMGPAGEAGARGGPHITRCRAAPWGRRDHRVARRLIGTIPLYPRGGGISPTGVGERRFGASLPLGWGREEMALCSGTGSE